MLTCTNTAKGQTTRQPEWDGELDDYKSCPWKCVACSPLHLQARQMWDWKMFLYVSRTVLYWFMSVKVTTLATSQGHVLQRISTFPINNQVFVLCTIIIIWQESACPTRIGTYGQSVQILCKCFPENRANAWLGWSSDESDKDDTAE